MIFRCALIIFIIPMWVYAGPGGSVYKLKRSLAGGSGGVCSSVSYKLGGGCTSPGAVSVGISYHLVSGFWFSDVKYTLLNPFMLDGNDEYPLLKPPNPFHNTMMDWNYIKQEKLGVYNINGVNVYNVLLSSRSYNYRSACYLVYDRNKSKLLKLTILK